MAGKPWFAKQHPATQLKRLLGRWSAAATFPNGDVVRGAVTYRWLAKDALMIARSRMRKLIPASVSILGADDVNNQLTMLYSDERGVTRTYAMKLTRTTLTFERKAPRFHQRFVGRFARNGREIRGAWQKSTTGRRWEHDFTIVYVSQASSRSSRTRRRAG